MFSRVTGLVLALPLLFVVTSCQSMSSGFFSIEGRAIVYEDTSIDGFDSSTEFDEKNIDVAAYGAQVALWTPIVDVLGSLDWREYESEDTPEMNLGVRRRFLEISRLHPYVEANLRYGFDLDNGVDTEDYYGYNVGLGLMLDMTENLFANVRLMYESAELELPSDDVTADGLVVTVGFGLRL